MSAQVDLYWADPTTSFQAEAANQISAAVAVQSIGNFPPSPDPSVDYSYSWTPDSSVVSTGADAGHVCLLAHAFCNSTDCTAPRLVGPGDFPDVTVARTAIHNIHVQDPTPGMMKRWPFHPWPFFFAARNGAGTAGKTRLVAHALNPADEADRRRILELLTVTDLRGPLGRCAKFALPAELHLGTGLETIVVPKGRPAGAPAPRLGFTGTVAPDIAADLVRGAWTKGARGHAVTHELELVPRQATQAAVHVVPHPDEAHIYAVDIRHEMLTGTDPIVMGGLTVIFTTPCRPW
jgi:hypothetical protein